MRIFKCILNSYCWHFERVSFHFLLFSREIRLGASRQTCLTLFISGLKLWQNVLNYQWKLSYVWKNETINARSDLLEKKLTCSMLTSIHPHPLKNFAPVVHSSSTTVQTSHRGSRVKRGAKFFCKWPNVAVMRLGDRPLCHAPPGDAGGVRGGRCREALWRPTLWWEKKGGITAVQRGAQRQIKSRSCVHLEFRIRPAARVQHRDLFCKEPRAAFPSW